MKSIFVLIDIALYSSLPKIAYKARLGLWQKITVLSEVFFLSRCGLSGLVWPDLAKFNHFGNVLKLFGTLWRVYLVFC